MEFKSCLNLSIFGTIDFETQLDATAKAGFKAVGLRMNIIKDYMSKGNSFDKIKQKLTEFKLDPYEMNFFSNWIFCTDSNRKDVLAEFRDFISISGALGCKMLVIPTAYENPTTKEMSLAVKNYQTICDMAAEYGLTAGLEFLPWTEINTIKKARELVEAANRPNGGIILDTFHFFEGHSSIKDLEATPLKEIVMFHLNDLNRIPNVDMVTLTRNHRVLIGDGVYHYDDLLKYFFDRKYDGYFNLEIINPTFAQKDPYVVAADCKRTLDSLLENYLRKAK
jgi:2-keto-myo-inositol isomerase